MPETDVARLLRDADQDVAARLANAFNDDAAASGCNMATVMWALANLQARVLALTGVGDLQLWQATQFQMMVQVALPAQMVAVEKAKGTMQ
jgi:hypothetical protein